MPTHPFKPFRRKPTVPNFPAWIIEELNHPKFPEPRFGRSHAEYIQPYIDANGLSLQEISERMRRPGDKTQMTPELVEENLADSHGETRILCRLFKALDVPWEGYRLYEEEQTARSHQALKDRGHLKHYRRQGPCLRALQTVESWLVTAGFSRPYHFTRQIRTGGKTEFHLPTAEEMAEVIATRPETCAHPFAQNHHVIGGYLYHRLPDELHVYDLQGQIIASGGISLKLPQDLFLTESRSIL